MTSILKLLKPYDFLLIGLALFISLAPWGYTLLKHQDSPTTTVTAIVKINGQTVDSFALSKTSQHQLITYHPNPGQYNIVEIDGDRIRVKEDNSPDQIAVRTGWVSQPGDILVCLPHQLVIELKGETSNEEELILPI